MLALKRDAPSPLAISKLTPSTACSSSLASAVPSERAVAETMITQVGTTNSVMTPVENRARVMMPMVFWASLAPCEKAMKPAEAAAKPAVPRLIQLLADPSDDVRDAAVLANAIGLNVPPGTQLLFGETGADDFFRTGKKHRPQPHPIHLQEAGCLVSNGGGRGGQVARPPLESTLVIT